MLDPRTRMHKLCSRALRETDPQKLAVLLTEIDDVLSETVDEIAEMLKEIEPVLRKCEQSKRIHLT